ncbi:type II toxin-antitoxin system RelE/ParE family toxin [Mucilaginibacter sp.]|uniref:type II toxin-antitoxin system RelE/ParE family toxin n=1 Tax=Mucilaginibacter sp. TaxID=1882438 RepID=UPI0026286992|nr:type II toxin-antitoxin system RelE/ParE family toxin [Mucilaginibacter sp.]MDB5031119.1 Toxin-antitoxin system, toxin component, RelE family [Mucilaginibacter sp.]
MSYNVLTITPFDKQLKKLVKKYPSLKTEIADLINQLKTEPDKGISLGNDCYKIRLAIASKGKGKSGGARVITYLTITDSEIYLLSIYDKSQQSDIEDKDLLRLIDLIR